VNFLRTVAALCSGFQTYRPFRDVPIKMSLKYLLQLMALLALLLTLSLIPWALHFGYEFSRWADKNLPPFSIKDGKLVIIADFVQPCRVSSANFLFILDTTGTATAPDTNAPSGMLFTTDKVVVWMSNTNVVPPVVVQRDVPLRGLPDGPVNGAYWRRLIHTSLGLGAPLLWMLMTMIGLLTCLLQAYLFSFVASFMERSMPAPLQLQQLLNIAIHAATPPAIIVTVYSAMRLPNLNLWVIYLIAYGIFLVGATNACRDTPRSSVAEA
jgi:hypothetical protein